MHIIYVRGGEPIAADIARRGGMAYGVRHDYKPYGDVFMLDIKWKNYDWAQYMEKVKQHKPQLAMVADYEHPNQKALMVSQINDLRRLEVPHIMVCPKFNGAVVDIPRDVILAVSVPTDYAGHLPAAEEVKGRRLHLLGGHPDQQNYLIWHRYRGVEVFSVDGNVLGYKAGMGQFWSLRKQDWRAAPKNKHATDFLAVMSAKAIHKYLSKPATLYTSKRVHKCMYDNLLVA